MDTPVETKPVHVEETEEPKYCVFADSWGPEFIGTDASDDSDVSYAGILGIPFTKITLGAKGIKKFRIRTKKKGKWSKYQTGFDKQNALGDGTPITGIEIVGKGFVYGVHIKGGSWLPTVITSDQDGEILTGSGSPIDAIWIEKL